MIQRNWILEHGMMTDSINSMNIQIDKKVYLTPRDTPPPRVGEELTKFISNTLDLYIYI